MTALLQWALDTQPQEDYPTPAMRKRALLAELNGALGTAYKEPHLNNWIAGRKTTPVGVWRILAAQYIKQTVSAPPIDADVIIETLGLIDGPRSPV